MCADYQAGVRPQRLEWVAETTEGTAPDNPSWNLFSDNVVSAWGWEPDANTQRQDGVGEITAQGFFNGAETHGASFSYDLQQWFYDNSSNIQDAAGAILEPSNDNSLPETHTVVGRSVQDDGGADSAGRHIYTVAKGGHPSSLTVPFETEDGSPIEVELSYQFQKIRQYDISQPADSTQLTVNNNGSSSVDVTLENADASTSETVTVAGGGSSTTTASFAELDVVELSTDVDGDVTVDDDAGTTLATIHGSNNYPTGEGDLGIPALGTGSHASALGSSYIRFIDDTLSIPNVESDVEIISSEMTVDAGLDDNAQEGTLERNIHAAEWTYEVTASLAGSKVSVDQVENYLQESTGTITWTEDSSDSIDFNNVFLQSPGEYTREAGNGKLSMDGTYEAESITVNT